MKVPRQDLRNENLGRINQKRRTRAAIVQAAQELVDAGEIPTVAAAAERALVSRTTAYRYFPMQESLLVELAVTVTLPDVEALVARPLHGQAPEGRLLDVFSLFNEHVVANEALYRRALKLYLEMWLASVESGESDGSPELRAGRRRRWIAQTLEPVRKQLPEAQWRTLTSALSLVVGVEAMLVLRDICQLEADEALEVLHWTADAILRAGLRETSAVPAAPS